MKKIIAIALASIVAVGFAGAQSPDEPEIRSASSAKVEFINYEGPHSAVDSAAAIRGIGVELAASLKAGTGSATAGNDARYAVIRAVDPSETGRFEADILVIGASAQVDHIRNLRLIISGYLETMHGYSRENARVLSVFITVYNAVHRCDTAYFGAKYKAVVLTYLSKENAGLSTRYDEWPGRSRIVIPLTSSGTAGEAKGPGVDTGTLSEKPVIDSMEKDNPDKGVEDRKGMVDIREGEIDDAKKAAEADRAAIAEEEKRIEAEKARLAGEKAALERDKAAAGTTGEEAAAGDPQSAELTKREAEIAAGEKEVAAGEKAVEEKKAAVTAAEAGTAAAEASVAAERADIAGDMKAAIAEEVAAKQEDARATILVVELVDPNAPYARLAMVNVDKGSFSKRSVVNTIRADSLMDAGGAYIAVAGKPVPGGAVRLVRLRKDSLEQEKESAVDVFPDTNLRMVGTELFAIVSEGGKYYLGSFDPATLTLNRRSSVEVSPFTWLGDSAKGFVVQKPDGGFAILGKADLKPVKEFAR
ncbi:MAG: P83/100 family protein [Spirochaetes bacterium]|nr:P83/100 family protein [Spirochaetota bacterium]